jgi:AcrR family transcriptional regulator
MAAHRPATARPQGARTRRRLLKAAKTLFLLKGFDAVTIDDICLAADASKGGFYHHFPDKESVFLEVASEELTREIGLSIHPASGAAAGRGESALLVDLWAWAPRRPQARRWVRVAHRQALKRLSKLPGQAAHGTSSRGDREAQAVLALLVGIGQVVQRASAPRPATGERERRKAAAG